MSAAPDPDLTAPRDPAAYRRPRLLGPGFWALFAFGALCILAGWAIAQFGPQVFPERPAPQVEAQEPVGPEALAPRPFAPAAEGATSLDAALDAASSPPPADVTALSERLAALEAGQARTTEAAAAALAAAALVEAAQSSRPFAAELAALSAVSPPSAEIGSLQRLAELGAPSPSALIASFPDYAARAAHAGRAPGAGAGVVERVGHALAGVVTIRRVGEVGGQGVDAILARAERSLAEGDLDGALRSLDALPTSAREALAPWRVRAERRAEIDRRVAALRAEALADLARLRSAE